MFAKNTRLSKLFRLIKTFSGLNVKSALAIYVQSLRVFSEIRTSKTVHRTQHTWTGLAIYELHSYVFFFKLEEMPKMFITQYIWTVLADYELCWYVFIQKYNSLTTQVIKKFSFWNSKIVKIF